MQRNKGPRRGCLAREKPFDTSGKSLALLQHRAVFETPIAPVAQMMSRWRCDSSYRVPQATQ
jgi:hypothetical protein